MTSSRLLERTALGPCALGELLDDIGVTEPQLRALVEELRAEGTVLDSSDGLVELVDPAGFGPRTLAWRCGQPVRFFERCGSTNDVARELAWKAPDRSGVLGGGVGLFRGDQGPALVVVAREQTAGRGRQGRTWQSEHDANLTLTMVLRPGVPAERAARAVLVWAAVLAKVLDVQLKWPNDLVDAQGRKLGGLLAELDLGGPAGCEVALGIGLNVNQRHFPGLPQATSLAVERGALQDRAAVCGAVVQALRAVPTAMLGGRGGLELWRRRSNTLGRQVCITALDGTVLAEGRAEDIRDDGALVVGGRPVLTGDVALVG